MRLYGSYDRDLRKIQANRGLVDRQKGEKEHD